MVCLGIAEVLETWLNIYILHIVFRIIIWILWQFPNKGRRDFPVSVLNRIVGGKDLHWYSHPPRGRSGGILLGVSSKSMEVLAVSEGDFHIKFHI